jgi:hypothetical protein
MEKNSWKTISVKTAKLHAHSKVEWVDNYGRTQLGKVKQIISDYVSITGDDGFTYVVKESKVKKRIFNGL